MIEWIDVTKAVYRRRNAVGNQSLFVVLVWTIVVGTFFFLLDTDHSARSIFFGMLFGFCIALVNLVERINFRKSSLAGMDKNKEKILLYLNETYKNMPKEWTEIDDILIVEAVERFINGNLV